MVDRAERSSRCGMIGVPSGARGSGGRFNAPATASDARTAAAAVNEGGIEAALRRRPLAAALETVCGGAMGGRNCCAAAIAFAKLKSAR